MTESRLYTGWLRHRRFSPVDHVFRYRVYMLYLDLVEVENGLFDRLGWFARFRFGPLYFRPDDYIRDGQQGIDASVRNLVESETGSRPEGPIRLLTTARSFGFGFNPISVYYCFNATGDDLVAMVASVTNTPWRRRQNYVLLDQRTDLPHFRAAFRKSMHVSPFNPMEMEYRWRSNLPNDNLVVHLENHRDGARVMDATVCLSDRPISDLGQIVWRHPFMAWKNVAAIHFEALRLWLRRAPVYDNPHQSPRRERRNEGETS